jgi:hypothetical protein
MVHVPLESLLPEFDHYLRIYTFFNFATAISTTKEQDQVLTAQPSVFLSA